MRFLIGLASVALIGVGCSAAEEQVRGELRNQMMARCSADIAPQAATIPGFDAERFCDCVADKAIGDRSGAELAKQFQDKAGMAARGRQAGAECIAEQLPNGASAVAGSAAAEERGGT